MNDKKIFEDTLLLYQMFFNIHPFKYTLKSDKK